MKNMLIASVCVLGLAGQVSAQVRVDPNARLIACYQEVDVPAQYNVTKTLVKEAERKYVRRNDRVELIENPAIYKETRTLKTPQHTVLEEIPCD